MELKSIDKTILEYVDYYGAYYLVNCSTAYERYEDLCKLLNKVPYPESNDIWVEEYHRLKTVIVDELNVILPTAYKGLWDEYSLLISSFKEYARDFIEIDNYLCDLHRSLTEKIENLIQQEKDFQVDIASHGEYDDLLENIEELDLVNSDRLVYTDHFNHVTEDTLLHGIIFNGEIEVSLPKDNFTERERDIIDLIIHDEVSSSLCIKDNGDDILVYDIFYLQILINKK